MIERIKLKEFSLETNSIVKDAVFLLTKHAHGIVYILDREKRVLGTVTDGDVRTGLLKGLDLQTKITKIMNTSFFSCTEADSHQAIKQMMEDNKITQIPVLSDDGVLLRTKKIGEFIKAEFDISTTLDVFVIMAGGVGSRLMPLTKEIPKPLIPVRNKPLIQHLINSAKRYGFVKFLICLNYRSDQIKDYLGDGSSQGIDIQYVIEEHRCGTAGALFLCLDNLTENFVVANADLLTSCNFSELVYSNIAGEKLMTIGVIRKEISIDFGVMECEGYTLKSIIEKPKIPFLINSGIYALNKKALELFPDRGFVDMTDIIQHLLNKHPGLINVFPIFENWMDVGTHEALIAAEKDI